MCSPTHSPKRRRMDGARWIQLTLELRARLGAGFDPEKLPKLKAPETGVSGAIFCGPCTSSDHRSSHPALRPWAPGFPGSSGLPAVPASHPRVTPRLHPPAHPAARLIQVALAPRLPWNPGCPRQCALQLCRRWVGELPRFPHPLALPALEFASCPAAPLFQLRLSVLPPGRPGFHTFRLSGDGASGRPALSILSALPLGGFFGSPRFLAPPAAPLGVSARSPRFPHPPVVPAMESRVAPLLASFGAAGAGVRELPRRSALPASPPDASTGSPRLSRLLALPRGEFSGCPEYCFPQPCRFCVPGLLRVLHRRLGR